MNNLKVFLWEEEIGQLSYDKRKGKGLLYWNTDWIHKNIDISPILYPTRNLSTLYPVWGEDEKLFHGLPSFLADSLPDQWGNELFEQWRVRNKLPTNDITPLDKLSFIGKRAMGALEFFPETNDFLNNKDKVNVSSLIELAERIYKDRENFKIELNDEVTMASLLRVGTSAGGAKPKAILSINRNTKEIKSGQVKQEPGFEYFILKFGDGKLCTSEIEMTYWNLCKQCKIPMADSELFPIDGVNHFMTKRFDRAENGEKVHMQTLAAMKPGANSYEALMSIARQLKLPYNQQEQIFRQMVFNILGNNTDDHCKNFSFLMNNKGSWSLAPAYDVTFIFDNTGFRPDRGQSLLVRGSKCNLTEKDLMDFACENDINSPKHIISEIADTLSLFRKYANDYNVRVEKIGAIESAIQNNIKNIGMSLSINPVSSSRIIDGHLFSSIKIEVSEKGYYKFSCTIDNESQKMVIRPCHKEYVQLSNAGLYRLTDDDKYRMAKELFLEKLLLKKKNVDAGMDL